MTSPSLPLKLSVLAVGIVSACSLTVPSEDEVFGAAGGGTSGGGTSGGDAGSFGNAPVGGDPSNLGGSGGTPGGGGQPTTSGTGPGAGGAEAGGAPQGGAGGEPPEPEPTGELVNPSFEDSLVGWTVEPQTPGIFVQYAEGAGAPVQAIDGTWVLSGWSKASPQKPYTARIYQVIKGIEDGTYQLTVHIMSIAGIPKANLYAANCGGADPEPVPSPSSNWTELVIDGIEVTGGECEVGVDIDARATDWVNVDKFTWSKVE